jgi:hypothetical protein
MLPSSAGNLNINPFPGWAPRSCFCKPCCPSWTVLFGSSLGEPSRLGKRLHLACLCSSLPYIPTDLAPTVTRPKHCGIENGSGRAVKAPPSSLTESGGPPIHSWKWVPTKIKALRLAVFPPPKVEDIVPSPLETVAS